MPSWGPESYTGRPKGSRIQGLCYRGTATKVGPLIENETTDTLFSDQLVMQGWRYKQTKKLADGAEDYEDSFPGAWQKWTGKGTSVLVVVSESDDGDDLNPAVIPHCRKAR